MIKDIKYGGYTAQPSDYECPDGQLSVALNCIPENGALSPIFPPKPIFSSQDIPYPVFFIHRSSTFIHYIVLKQSDDAPASAQISRLYWTDGIRDNEDKITLNPICGRKKDETGQIKYCPVDFFGTKNTRHFTGAAAVGNTLIITAEDGFSGTRPAYSPAADAVDTNDDGTLYFLWKADENRYIYLGNHIPECPLSLGLIHTENKQSIVYSYSALWSDIDIDNVIRGAINQFIAEAHKAGKFLFSFVLRYAFRLYDGSLTMHSAPIRMMCANGVTPMLNFVAGTGDNGFDGCDVWVTAPLFDIGYSALNQESILAIQDWKDIISSIDIYISQPIYSYAQDDADRDEEEAIRSHSAYCLANGVAKLYSYSEICPVIRLNGQVKQPYGSGSAPHNPHPEKNPHFPSRYTKAQKELADCHVFRLAASINISSLTTEFKALRLEKGIIETIATRKEMSDDFISHDFLHATSAYAYNNRLNLGGITRTPFSGFDAAAMANRCDSDSLYTCYVQLQSDFGDNLIVRNSPTSNYLKPEWFYYPSASAKYLTVEEQKKDGTTTFTRYRLKAHDFLNGSIVDSTIAPETTDKAPDVTQMPRIHLANRIYTSEVNNPFFFPTTSIYNVGVGHVLRIVSAAKALSEGQFGQFPLYAFTTEGVWALEVSATGTYSFRQPITRDVCINADGITQLDSAVLFPTARGIMLISGSQTQCISDPIDSEFPFNAQTIETFNTLHSIIHKDDMCLPTLPFTAFLENCRMLYDYVHQHIIVYNSGITYAYVFSLKSRQWGMITSDIVYSLNSYPDALAVDSQNNIVNFSDTNYSVSEVLVLTRPLKLDAPDILKTIDTIIQRGHFRPGHVQSVLYGSRDLYNWHLVWSSKDHYLRGFRGTPYKYFRIALLCDLAPGESIYGASVQFTPRLTNQPR